MTQYIKPILFAVLISLASSAVFAAAHGGSNNPSDDTARRSPVGRPPADEDTSGYYVTDAIGAGLSKLGSAATAAAKRVGAEFREFATETVPDGVAAMREDATYAGGLLAGHAQTAGTALRGHAATAGAAMKNHAATAGDAVMGDSEAKREAAAARYPQPIKGALEAAADFAAVHRDPDAGTVSPVASGAGTAVATAGAPIRSDDELRALQAAKLEAHKAAHTGDGSSGSADPS